MAAQQIFRLQSFDHFVVIDFEATCDKNVRVYPQEIIEFPAVLVDGVTGCLVSVFRTYVRPRHHPRLTAFCTELTGIQQDQVDGGVDLAQALAMHDAWLVGAGVEKNRLAVVTWGDWDCRTMLEFECTFKGLNKPAYFGQWVNLRIPFESVFGARRRNLQEAVEEAGLQWDGRPHCGLDDARNTALLLADLMRRGISISITGSLAPKEQCAMPQLQHQPQSKEQCVMPQLQHQPQTPPQDALVFNECGGDPGDTQQPPQGTVNLICSYSYCGVPVRLYVMTTPGHMQGRCFYVCGYWTPSTGAMCPFFFWAA